MIFLDECNYVNLALLITFVSMLKNHTKVWNNFIVEFSQFKVLMVNRKHLIKIGEV
jgi:hypothetical protein